MKRRMMGRKGCWWNGPAVGALSACCCGTARGGRSASAHRLAPPWGACFCASGLEGVDRNLTRGEILEQMLLLARQLPDEERLSHIVVMGMGEPLANLDQLLPALDRASSSTGLEIGVRRITISTVGLPAAMHRLADRDPRFQLAVSLHAPNDELRNRLVPVNRKIGLNAVLLAADRYFEVSGRRLTFEYVLLSEINDRAEHARELAQSTAGTSRALERDPLQSRRRLGLSDAVACRPGAVSQDPGRQA